MTDGDQKKKKKNSDLDQDGVMDVIFASIVQGVMQSPDIEDPIEDVENPENLTQTEGFESGSKTIYGLSANEFSLRAAFQKTTFSPVDIAERNAVRTVACGSLENIYGQYNGVRYEFGGKAIEHAGDGIDCSGLAYLGLKEVMGNLGLGRSEIGGFYSSSEGQLQAAIKKGVPIRTNGDLSSSSFQGGELLFTDNGERGWDANRRFGIDHAMMTFKDQEDGKVYVLQSTGSKGVHRVPIEEWFAKNQNTEMYVADMVDIAQTAAGYDSGMLAKNDIRTEFSENKFENPLRATGVELNNDLDHTVG